MPRIERKSLDAPDDSRQIEKAVTQVVTVGSVTIGRGILEPGWRWSTHVQPLMGTPSCPVHHLNLILAGRFMVRMDDGQEVEFNAGDVADVPPGHDAWVVGDEPVTILDVFGNAGELGLPAGHQRIVTTVLMSDIVASTAMVSRLGDAAWKGRLAEHNRVIRTQLDRYRGREINTTGDGFVATFASAIGALQCAAAIRDATRRIGLEIRVGVHTGEVELLGDDIGGVAVHATARIMSLGGASEVIVSSVARGLAEGSGLRFEERGRHAVKGLEQPVEVYALVE
ncbi:MAG: hypothetical protein M3295_06680 [Chloroflexota bacterium]|nr:hypothetical protein [Chloroflexota bacterium]